MPFDPDNPADITRLRDAAEHSRKEFSPHREKRLELIKQYVGTTFPGGSKLNVPVNMIELTVNTYLQHLAAKEPQVEIVALHSQFYPDAYEMELALNYLLKEINFAETHERWVLDSLFSMGILKVGITDDEFHEVRGFTHDGGQPYADVVDIDDWVHDMTAKSWDEIGYCGNRYRLPYEFVMENDRAFPNSKAKEKLTPTQRMESADLGGGEKVSEISKGGSSSSLADQGEFQKMIELWDYWIPKEKLLLTLASEGGEGQYLSAQEWHGPKNGPYIMLAGSLVPSNIMPLPLVGTIRDLHELVNLSYRKLHNEIERMKTVTVVPGAAVDDGGKIVTANDGEVIVSDMAEKIRELTFGGADQSLLGSSIHIWDLTSRMAGNLEGLAGLGAQADTLGQEQLISQQTSKRINSMQKRVVSAVEKVIKSLAWYLWNDPTIQLPLTKRTSIGSMPFTYDQSRKGGSFNDYNFKIRISSMTGQSPGQLLNTLRTIWREDIMGMPPQMLAEAGISPDLTAYLRQVANWADLPELEELLDFSVPPEGGGPVNEPKQASHTTRENVRINKSSATRQGSDKVLQSMLSGANNGNGNGQGGTMA